MQRGRREKKEHEFFQTASSPRHQGLQHVCHCLVSRSMMSLARRGTWGRTPRWRESAGRLPGGQLHRHLHVLADKVCWGGHSESSSEAHATLGWTCMRLQLLSDLHFEFHRDGGRSFVESLDPSGVDVLVLPAISTLRDGIPAALALLCRRFRDASVCTFTAIMNLQHEPQRRAYLTGRRRPRTQSCLARQLGHRTSRVQLPGGTAVVPALHRR